MLGLGFHIAKYAGIKDGLYPLYLTESSQMNSSTGKKRQKQWDKLSVACLSYVVPQMQKHPLGTCCGRSCTIFPGPQGARECSGKASACSESCHKSSGET